MALLNSESSWPFFVFWGVEGEDLLLLFEIKFIFILSDMALCFLFVYGSPPPPISQQVSELHQKRKPPLIVKTLD